MKPQNMQLPVNTTYSDELDQHIKKKYSEYEIWPAQATSDIFVGFLCKKDDSTWYNPLTYYYNNNYPGEWSIKNAKI